MNLEGGENSEEVDACHEESDILQKLFFFGSRGNCSEDISLS